MRDYTRLRKPPTARRGPSKRPVVAERSSPKRASTAKRWSAKVTARSDAMDIAPDVFTRGAKAIAQAVKRSAERSQRRKSSPFRSAMSLLTFYANRAGRNLSPRRQQALERAKDELRKLFGRGGRSR